MIYWVSYYLFRLFSFLFFPRKVYGRENLPKDGRFIVASNHISNLDPFIVGVSSGRRLNYVAKEELFKNKILGSWLKQINAFPIKRSSSDFRAFREIFRRLNKGMPVVLFPEGTRIAHKKKIQPGIGFIAIKSQLPIIPVFVEGSDRVLPPGCKIPRRYPVKVTFGEPLRFSKGDDYIEIAHQIMLEINKLGPQK